MRKTASSFGMILDQGFGLAVVRRVAGLVLRNWRARQTLRKLQAFDDGLLADIGLTRDDVGYGLSLPAARDIMDEMQRIRDDRLRRAIRRP